MAKAHRKTAVAVPQAKVRTIQILRNESPEQLRRREYFNFGALEEGLDKIRAISDVLDYTQDICQGGDVLSMTIISAGLAEALRVVHGQLAKQVEVGDIKAVGV